jgi:hypothetical protein
MRCIHGVSPKKTMANLPPRMYNKLTIGARNETFGNLCGNIRAVVKFWKII